MCPAALRPVCLFNMFQHRWSGQRSEINCGLSAPDKNTDITRVTQEILYICILFYRTLLPFTELELLLYVWVILMLYSTPWYSCKIPEIAAHHIITDLTRHRCRVFFLLFATELFSSNVFWIRWEIWRSVCPRPNGTDLTPPSLRNADHENTAATVYQTPLELLQRQKTTHFTFNDRFWKYQLPLKILICQ